MNSFAGNHRFQRTSAGDLIMPRQLEWTPRLVARFWDGVAQSVTLDAMSFAKLAGPVLMDFMCPWIAPGARCLDFGGGSGHLLSLMAKAGYRSAIFEPSIQRAAKVTASMTDEPRFLGAISLHDPETFDFVICTEVIEHISRPGTESFMHSMTRRIAPGGLLFLTTPFAEILAENQVYCPLVTIFFIAGSINALGSSRTSKACETMGPGHRISAASVLTIPIACATSIFAAGAASPGLGSSARRYRSSAGAITSSISAASRATGQR